MDDTAQAQAQADDTKAARNILNDLHRSLEQGKKDHQMFEEGRKSGLLEGIVAGMIATSLVIVAVSLTTRR